MPNYNVVYLQIVRNGIFKLRNVQIIPVPIMQDGRLADAQESRFQASKRSNMVSAFLLGVRCADIQEFFSTCKTFRYGLCRNARRSVSGLSAMGFSGCETFRIGQCRPARGLIC